MNGLRAILFEKLMSLVPKNVSFKNAEGRGAIEGSDGPFLTSRQWEKYHCGVPQKKDKN